MPLKLFNSLTRQKEVFEPLNAPYVGMYVCGPTVSGESHLGHARPFITFDILYRYLIHLGYKVRYVRNITDAGHFEEEGRDAEDKVSEKAKIEKLEHQLRALEIDLNRGNSVKEINARLENLRRFTGRE